MLHNVYYIYRSFFGCVFTDSSLLLVNKAKVRLDNYDIPDVINRLLSRGLKMRSLTTEEEASELRNLKACLEEGARVPDKYAQRFKVLLYAEEHQMHVDIRHYDMEVMREGVAVSNRKFNLIASSCQNVPMTKHKHHLYLVVPGLAENRPSVLKGDKLYVHLVSDEMSDDDSFGAIRDYHHHLCPSSPVRNASLTRATFTKSRTPGSNWVSDRN